MAGRANAVSDLERAEHINTGDSKGVKRVANYGYDDLGNLVGQSSINDLIHDNVHTGEKELRVFSEGHVCNQNSTSTPLGINGVFTGDWQDTLDYSEVIISVYTDKNSITNGLAVYWSADGVTVHGDDFFTISASSGKTFSFPCQNRYVKVVYTNDGVAQTYFTLQTLLKRFASKGSSHRLLDNLNQEDDAIVTKSQIVGFSSAGGGSLVNVKANPSGALTVDSTVTSSVLPTGAATEATLAKLNSFSLPVFDYISLGYTGANLTTVVYKTGGSGGTTVATLTLGYDGSNNLTSVTKS